MANVKKQLHRLGWLTMVLLFSSAMSGCSQEVKKTAKTDSLKNDWDQTIPGNFSGQSKTVFDSTQIASFFERYPAVKTYEPEVRTFYRQRRYAYAWFDDGQLIEQASNLANRVMNLDEDGIYKTIPYQRVLDSLLHERSGNAKDGPQDVETEIMLTTQYFVFAKLAWRGMNTATSKSSGWFVPRKKIAYPQYLDSLLQESDTNPTTTEPVYRQYELLRVFLRKYRALDQKDQWLPIKFSQQNLKRGDSSAVIRQLKVRLFKLEDYHGDTSSTVYTEELVAALKVFQERHGFQPNGRPDKATLAGLNVPLTYRIKQILVNMERSRWLPVKLTGDYLAVNIPEYQLHVYHADSLLWSCKVVVGQTVHPTTVFYGEVKQVVFSPYWNLPRGIIRYEVATGHQKKSAIYRRAPDGDHGNPGRSASDQAKARTGQFPGTG